MSAPRVSVVVPTRDRCDLLLALLDSLRAQSLPAGDFEVIVVDDGSADGTQAALADARAAGDLDLTFVRQPQSRGPAAARNAGWRAARGALIAFVDDDCRAEGDWLERGLAIFAEHPNAVIQGRVELDPEHLHAFNPFAHWFVVHDADQGFPTANIFYPRGLLERLGGFDESFGRAAGEDTDLGWRAIEAGAEVVFARDALVFHAIIPMGPMYRLRQTARWSDTVVNYRRHPGMKKYKGIFWRHNHWVLFRFLVALALPRRYGPIRLWLAAPYVVHLTDRRSGPLLAPYLLALDLAEVYAVVRGAIKHRVLVV